MSTTNSTVTGPVCKFLEFCDFILDSHMSKVRYNDDDEELLHVYDIYITPFAQNNNVEIPFYVEDYVNNVRSMRDNGSQ
jgi:hypothetical protein